MSNINTGVIPILLYNTPYLVIRHLVAVKFWDLMTTKLYSHQHLGLFSENFLSHFSARHADVIRDGTLWRYLW